MCSLTDCRNPFIGAPAGRSVLLGMGLWLVVLAVYAWTSTGRIDFIDAQFKFETSASLVDHGDTLLRDPYLIALLDNPKRPFAPYPLGSPLTGIPLATIGLWLSPDSREIAQFLWSLTSAFFGALIAPTLFFVWRGLGLSQRSALSWALAVSFGTLLWPLASSSFDQAQQAWLLLVAVILAEKASATERQGLAFAAGAVFSAILHYQPAYIVLLVPLTFCLLWRPSNSADLLKLRIPLLVVLGAAPGIVALLAYNVYRFGSPFMLALSTGSIPLLDNPVLGALVLTVSPGKGIVFFSPIVLVVFLGIRPLWRLRPRLLLLVGGVTALQFVLVASLSFPAGDWCWGPRYLVTTLPLVALLLPFGALHLRRKFTVLLLALSVAIQILGLTVDHQRFFRERGLEDHFWLHNQAFYFRESQLIARVEELLDQDVPSGFAYFSSGPSPLLTYAPFGPPSKLVPSSRLWMRQFAMYYLPRPWPLWMARIRAENRPFNPLIGTIILGGVGLFGALIFDAASRFRRDSCE